jgi:hypothetical protein
MPYIWTELRRDGPMSIIEVVTEPGRTAEIPVRTSIVGKPAMDELLGAILARHAETKDQLGEFS